MKTKLCYLLLVIPILFLGCDEKDDSPIEGVWELMEAKWDFNGTVTDFERSDDVRMVKIFTEGHFTFLNLKADTICNNTFGGHGSYTIDETTFTEKLDFMFYEGDDGKSFTYEYVIKGDTLVQEGPISISPDQEIDWELREVYIRKE